MTLGYVMLISLYPAQECIVSAINPIHIQYVQLATGIRNVLLDINAEMASKNAIRTAQMVLDAALMATLNA
jgi:hypothetical protein